MDATALTDAERWPLLTGAGAANLARLRTHPHAPPFNHACGDRLTAPALARLRAHPPGHHGWTPDTEPPWVMDLVDRVYATVPAYRHLPRPTRLTDVPPLTRHDLLTAAELHVPDNADLAEMIVYRTSGSRGPAATVPMTPEFCALDLPMIEHVLAEAGITVAGGPDRVSLVNVYHQPVAYQFASVSSYWNGAGVVKVNTHPTAWRTPTDRRAFLDDLAPELYTGNPISLAALAEIGLTTRPKAVLSGAMALDQAAAATLAHRLGAPVFDLYGITEAGLIAHRTGTVHTVLPRQLLIEVLDPAGTPCPPGTPGEIAVTCGENALLPLLRYRTGDHAALTWHNGLPALAALHGRDPVMFRSATGAVVNSIELTHVLSPLAMLAYHLHQHADGAVEIAIHSPGPPPTTVSTALRSLLGDVPITVTESDLSGESKPQRYTADAPHYEPAGSGHDRHRRLAGQRDAGAVTAT
ncbi:AMP-binding protein [Actinokineospora sp. G85]|uniref:AMP-binding protein n=1 Tax=Actinokineospora sp. G85 TaxID=3406626 RepID=UPI003C776ABE